MLVVNPRQEDSTIPRIELDMVWWVHSVAVAVFAFEIIKKEGIEDGSSCFTV